MEQSLDKHAGCKKECENNLRHDWFWKYVQQVVECITAALNKAGVAINPLDKTASCTFTSAPTDKDTGALKYLFLSISIQRGQQEGQTVQIPAGMDINKLFFLCFFSLFFGRCWQEIGWETERQFAEQELLCGVFAQPRLKHGFLFVSTQKEILFSRSAWQRERERVCPRRGSSLYKIGGEVIWW